MTGQSARAVAAVLVAVVALLLAGSSAGSAPVAPACAAASHCLQDAAPARAPAPVSCLSDPSCGGGAHAGQADLVASPPLAAVTALAGIAAFGLLRRRPAAAWSTGRLLAGGLYRPPRLSV